MVKLIITDQIEIQNGGNGPCKLLRKYSVIGDASKDINIQDLIPNATTICKCGGKSESDGVYCKTSSFKILIKISDYTGGEEEEILSINAVFPLKEAIPNISLNQIIANTSINLPLKYSCCIIFPFVLDNSVWHYETVTSKIDHVFNLDQTHRKLELQSFDIPQNEDDDFTYTVKISSARPLPLLYSLGNQYSKKNIFQDIHIVLIPHLLDDFPYFADTLIKAGVKKENIYIVGIPYSTQEHVVQKLKGMGLQHVYDPPSYPFNDYIDALLNWINDKYLELKKQSRPFKWLIIEDGGYIVPAIHKKNPSDGTWDDIRKCCLGAVEQTRNGIWAYQDQIPWYERKIPVCSVADARIKLELESRWIGKAIYKNISDFLPKCTLLPKTGDKALVLGLGSTGRQIAKAFNNNGWDVTGYDKSATARAIARGDNISVLSPPSVSPWELVKGKRLVIGATGKDNAIDANYINAMDNGTVIINASSKRKEIDWSAFAPIDAPQQIGPGYFYYFPDRYGNSRQIVVLAKGFPVNFYSGKSVDPADIELILGCLFQAAVEIVLDKDRPAEEKLFKMDIKKKELYQELGQRHPTEEEKRYGIFVFPSSLEEKVAEIWMNC